MNKVNKALKEVDNSIENYDEEKVKQELNELINQYKVPVDQAISSIIRKYQDSTTNRAGKKQIKNIESDESGIEITGRIIRKTPRTIEVEGEERDVVSGTLGDESGIINFTAWIDFPYEEGDVIQIRNGYTREWQNQPELQIGDYTDIAQAEESVPSLEKFKSPKKVTIQEIDKVYLAKVEATIIDVLERSGLIMRCPECNRVTKGNECQEHGEVEPEPDLRIKAILDDGLGTVQATLPQEVTQKLTGISLSEAKEMARDALDRSVVEEEMKEVIGETVIVKGRSIGNNFLVNEIEKPQWAPKEKAKQILDKLKEMEA
ncbi:hypothetical protein C9439_01980 [archaeon SCG-AAA382B04]|nr:hypothetical protein C9439_01980 [archaeon SCG-AAA382B04]